MDKPVDPELQNLEYGIAILLRFEEGLIDAVAEAAASARQAGQEAKAALIEDHVRHLRVDFLKRRSMIAAL